MFHHKTNLNSTFEFIVYERQGCDDLRMQKIQLYLRN